MTKENEKEGNSITVCVAWTDSSSVPAQWPLNQTSLR